jgi:hypothetical protein
MESRLTPVPRLAREGNHNAGDAWACGCPRAKFQLSGRCRGSNISRMPWPTWLHGVRYKKGGRGMDAFMVIFGFLTTFCFGPTISFFGILMMRDGLRAMGYW